MTEEEVIRLYDEATDVLSWLAAVEAHDEYDEEVFLERDEPEAALFFVDLAEALDTGDSSGLDRHIEAGRRRPLNAVDRARARAHERLRLDTPEMQAQVRARFEEIDAAEDEMERQRLRGGKPN